MSYNDGWTTVAGAQVPEVNSSKFFVSAGWRDVPHLDAETQKELLENTPPHLRKARSEGTPSLGSGAIYPIEQEQFTCAPFAIPRHFAKAYGLDVGWNKTAAIFGAWDREDDILYIYSEHYRGHAEPSVHAASIKARGEWIKGTIDPAAKGRSQRDGKQLLADYVDLGLNLVEADNGVEAGILHVWERMASGRLKVFTSCQNLLAEHRLYRRDEKGAIVKKFDHAMDALRYLVRMLPLIASTKPVVRNFVSSNSSVADTLGGY